MRNLDDDKDDVSVRRRDQEVGEMTPLGPLCCTFAPKSKRAIHALICKHCGQPPNGFLHSKEAHEAVRARYHAVT